MSPSQLPGIAAILVLLHVAFAVPAPAQSVKGNFGIFAGATFPDADLNNELETGFNLGVALGLRSPAYPLALRLDATWHQLSLASSTGNDSEALRIVAGTANLQYDLPLPFAPYLIGGIGAYNLRDPRLDGDENQFGWSFGAGMRVFLLPVETLIELRFHRISGEDEAMTIVPVSVGVMF